MKEYFPRKILLASDGSEDAAALGAREARLAEEGSFAETSDESYRLEPRDATERIRAKIVVPGVPSGGAIPTLRSYWSEICRTRMASS